MPYILCPATPPWGRHAHAFIWWLIPLIGLSVVLLASYNTLRVQRFDKANSPFAPLLPEVRIGQSFIARYPNLSGIDLPIGTFRETPGPARASLVLHLRAAPTPGPDLATARLPVGEWLGVNPWYHFSFPPIADSQDRPFYLEVESPDGSLTQGLTLFWWQPTKDSDPYPYGTAYRNGQIQHGDLAFALEYSASPLDVWAIAGHVASINFQPVLTALWALVAAAGLFLLMRLTRLWQDAGGRRRWLLRWSLPLVLIIALLNGLTYLLLIPPWQGPDEPAHFAYAALLDHHGLDVGAVQRLESTMTDQDTVLSQALSASVNRHNFTRLMLGQPYPGMPIDIGIGIYGGLAEPPAYHWLCAAGLRLAQAVGWPVDPYIYVENALWLMRGFSLMISLGVVALAWLAGVLLSSAGQPWFRILLPLTVALLPMHAFISATATNNGLAELVVTAQFVTLLALLRRPGRWWSPILALLAGLLLFAGLPSKATALLGGLPLLGLGLVFAGSRLVVQRIATWPTMRRGDRIGGRWLILALLGLLLGAGAVLLTFEIQDRAVNWRLNRWVVEPAPRTAVAMAHAGAYVLELGPNTPQGVSAEQVVLSPFYHPAFTMTVAGWARRAPGSAVTPATEVTARLVLQESVTRIGREVVAVDPSGGWTPITVAGHVSASTSAVLVMLKAPEQLVQFDDLSLQVTGLEGPWPSAITRPRLLNPSFENATLGLRPWLVSILPWQGQMIASVLLNPQPFDKEALWQYYADQQNRSFWGNFGWLSLSLPEGLYQLIGALVVVALAGLIAGGIRRWGRWALQEWAALLAVLAFISTLVLEFASQMMLLVTRENPLYPQGRYLFVLIIPIAWLLIAGLREAWALLAAGVARLAGRRAPSPTEQDAKNVIEKCAVPRLSWGAWLWLNACIMFAAYCLLALIVPFYWGN